MLSVDAVSPRWREVGWVLDYLPDLEADFLAFYGVDDMLALPGPRFLRLASRTVAYEGVMRARAQALMDAEQAEDTHIARSSGRPAAPAGGLGEVTSQSVLAAGLGDVISFGGG
jgi:hypothetical protein